jgi:hypothetical protein
MVGVGEVVNVAGAIAAITDEASEVAEALVTLFVAVTTTLTYLPTSPTKGVYEATLASAILV